METFAKLFERFLVFVYHCFHRIVIQGYMPLPTRPEHIVHFFRDVHGQYPITPHVLAKRTLEYRGWVESYAHNHKISMLRAEAINTGFTASSPAWNWAARSVRKCPGFPPTIRTTASSGASRPATCIITSTSAIRWSGRCRCASARTFRFRPRIT